MSRPRTFSWSAALRDIHSDRVHFAPGERQRLLREQGFADLAFRRANQGVNCRMLLAGNSYDRRGIMLVAIDAARARREVTGEPWRACLSSALKGTWKAAKAAKAAMEVRAKVRAAAAERATLRMGAGEGSSDTTLKSAGHAAPPDFPATLRVERRLIVHPQRSLPRRSPAHPSVP